MPPNLLTVAHDQAVALFGRACREGMQRPLWAIVGPTAAGKSALAMALAPSIDAEIISADAVAVYRGCTIGSAKPSPQEQGLVPHHLIDCADPQRPFDASQFVAAADGAIATLWAKGRVPLLCGGTGLYLRALRQGLIDVPKDPALRAELEAADAAAPGTSLERLRALDPQSARTIDGANGAYVRRALEITLLSGQPASALRAAHSAQPVARPMLLWWIDREDDDLRRRIVSRADAMLEGGIIDEVQGLLQRGVEPSCNALRSVGYREVVAMLQGQLPSSELRGALIKGTWNYARRQRIWLRREQRQHPQTVHRLLLPAQQEGAPRATDVAARGLTALWHQMLQPPPGGGSQMAATTGSTNR